MGRAIRQPLSVDWLARAIGREWAGAACTVNRVDSAAVARRDSLCFVKNEAWAARSRDAGVVLGDASHLSGRPGAAIHSPTARLDFARLLASIDASVGFVWRQAPPQIHPTARIGANAVIGPGVRIGAHTVVAHNVVIGAEVVIGERCHIKSGAVIGEEGFGFERDEHGKAVRLPHLGSVRIGNEVEVGSLTTVCRGTLEDTVLCDGAKIDDHVHIAHNVQVGQDAFVIACAEVSGGVKIGARAWIAPAATVLNQVSIGDDAVIGLGAVVVRSVAAGATVVGNPARPMERR